MSCSSTLFKHQADMSFTDKYVCEACEARTGEKTTRESRCWSTDPALLLIDPRSVYRQYIAVVGSCQRMIYFLLASDTAQICSCAIMVSVSRLQRPTPLYLGNVRNEVKHGPVDERYRPRCPRNARCWHAAVSCGRGRVVYINPPHEASSLFLLPRTSLKRYTHIMPLPYLLPPPSLNSISIRPYIAACRYRFYVVSWDLVLTR